MDRLEILKRRVVEHLRYAKARGYDYETKTFSEVAWAMIAFNDHIAEMEILIRTEEGKVVSGYYILETEITKILEELNDGT